MQQNHSAFGRLILLTAALFLVGSCSDDTTPITPDPDLGVPLDGLTPVEGLRPDTGPVPHKALALKVVHLNDTHANVEPVSVTLKFKNEAGTGTEDTSVQAGGFARVIAKINALRAANPRLLVLHAGDVFQGTLWFMQYLGIADAELLNLAKVDAMTFGNHEFDRGPEPLAAFVNKINFPVVSSNVDVSKNDALKALTNIKPYLVKEIDGEKVAIIGLTTPDASTISSPGTTITFADPIARVKELVKQVEDQGINKVILLSHLGYDQDRALAKAVEGVDVIVGGHTHKIMGPDELTSFGISKPEPYPVSETTPAGKPVCIVQAWEYTKLLGMLDLELDKEGFVTKCGGSPIMLLADAFGQLNPTTKKVEPVVEPKKTFLVNQVKASTVLEIIEPDGAAVTKITSMVGPIDTFKSVEIADVTENLFHIRVPTVVPGFTHSSGEAMPNGSYIAPHVAEAFLARAKALGHPAQVALVNGGGVRIDIKAGKLTQGQVFTLLPFNNTLYLLKVTGTELKATLDAAVAKATSTGNTGGPFPYGAGLRYTADLKQATGSLITQLEILDGTTWKAVEPATTYLLVTLGFLAGGGDFWEPLKNVTAFRLDLNFAIDAESFVQYAKAKQSLARLPPLVTVIPK